MTNNLGFVKVAACSFPIELGNTMANAKSIVNKVAKAQEDNVKVLVFPELCITGYTCGDMFLRNDLLEQAKLALEYILKETRNSTVLFCVGMPIVSRGRVFNCAVWCQIGYALGVVPKTYIPNYNEFYEKRWFASSTCRIDDTVEIAGDDVLFSEDILIDAGNGVIIGTEICEDLWVDNPPSGMLSRAGATVIVNPSASNDTIGKREYRRNLVMMQSGRCRAAYIYASSGIGESSTDLVFSGHCMIAENGRMVKEDNDSYITGVIDIEKCLNDRRKYNSEAWSTWDDLQKTTTIRIPIITDNEVFPEKIDAYPFVPSNKEDRYRRCNEVLNLQARGLMQRLRSLTVAHVDKVVLGLSGGLDSTLALLVCVRAFDLLNVDRKNIHCITMPGFGTSKKTRAIVDRLANGFGVTLKEVDITSACSAHLADLGHPEDVYDNTYENAQARERTQILFDYANMINGIVIGTGDMSELALGWCTYNGDHMSNYAVNTGVPKTLVKYIVGTYGENMKQAGNNEVADVLEEICGMVISPELLPTDANGDIAQDTEASIGKYDLHDFFLYNFLRNGFSKEKILTLANIAFKDVVDEKEIAETLDTFYSRFRTQQFKRSCIPDGVKVGSVALSPRGDWRMPSDMTMMY